MVVSDGLVDRRLDRKAQERGQGCQVPPFNDRITYGGDRFSVGPEIVPQKGTALRGRVAAAVCR